jgi:hypothetical protein
VRFVRRNVPVSHADFGKSLRCATCCEGNNIHPEREARAIQQYLTRYTPTLPEEQRAEAITVMVAAQNEYRRINGDPRDRFRGRDADGAAIRRGGGWRHRSRDRAERAGRESGEGLASLGDIMARAKRQQGLRGGA